MSLYENKKNSNLPDIEKVGFTLGKNFNLIMLVYTLATVVTNFSAILGESFYLQTKGLIGYFFGLMIIFLSIISIVKPKSIYFALLSIIYFIGVLSVIPVTMNQNGFIDSQVFWGDSFWFLTWFFNYFETGISPKSALYLQFLPASLIFLVMYILSIKSGNK